MSWVLGLGLRGEVHRLWQMDRRLVGMQRCQTALQQQVHTLHHPLHRTRSQLWTEDTCGRTYPACDTAPVATVL
jgi:hypothetical protein